MNALVRALARISDRSSCVDPSEIRLIALRAGRTNGN
jgi:hypothetical protein